MSQTLWSARICMMFSILNSINDLLLTFFSFWDYVWTMQATAIVWLWYYQIISQNLEGHFPDFDALLIFSILLQR